LTEKNSEKYDPDNQPPGLNLNPELHKYEARVPAASAPRFVYVCDNEVIITVLDQNIPCWGMLNY
jgi:hypothetical protein